MKTIAIACALLLSASAQAGVSIIYNNPGDYGHGLTIGYNVPGYWAHKRYKHRHHLQDRRMHRRYHRWQHYHGHRHHHAPRYYDHDGYRGCPTQAHNHGRRHYRYYGTGRH